MADKRVTLQVDTDVNDSKIKAIDEELQRLKMQRLQLNIDANKEKLYEIESQIEGIDAVIETSVDLSDEELDELSAELAQLQSQKVNLQIAVADDELTKAKAEEEALNTTANVDIAVNDSAVQGAMQNINDGINQTKQGLGELSGAFNEVQQAGMQSEQNKAFLKMNLGADKAKQTYQDISDIVASMPGDDNTMRSVLSTAQALGNNLNKDEMTDATKTMADYMSGSATMGKQAIESQQDIMKYLLDGNTAELERGSIVSSQVDKLKEATTFQERQKAMQEVLNDLGYGGIATQDTMLNKQAEWEGMLYNSEDTLSSMWLGAEKGAMDFFLKLNDVSGGLAGIGLVAATQLGPGLLSIGQGAFTALPGIMQFSEKVGGLSGITTMVSSKISGLPGILGTAGSALTGLGLGPIALIIAALVALGVAIFEVGKAFGWWSDLGTMFEAISAGATAMWNAFMNNEYVIQIIDLIKQGLTDAWNAISGFGQAVMSALGGAGGQFDILSWAINGLQTVLSVVGPVVVLAIQGMIQHFRNIYAVAQIVWPYVAQIINGAIGVIRGIISGAMGIWSGLQGAWHGLQSTASTVFGAINGVVSAAGSAWQGFKSTVMGVIQPIIDKINDLKNAASGVGDLLHSVGLGGVEVPSVNASYGSGGYTNVSQGNTIIFNMYGDIRDEKTLDDTIDAINNRIQFEALSNGSVDNPNGGVI